MPVERTAQKATPPPHPHPHAHPRSPVLEVLGRAAAEPQGSEAGVEVVAQGSLLFMGGTEGGAPHGSTGATGLGADPGEGEDFSVGGGGGGSNMR